MIHISCKMQRMSNGIMVVWFFGKFFCLIFLYFWKPQLYMCNAPSLLAAINLTNICHCIFQHILPRCDCEKQDAHLFFHRKFFLPSYYKARAHGRKKSTDGSSEKMNVFLIIDYIAY